MLEATIAPPGQVRTVRSRWQEFGRRMKDDESDGLDHGAGSNLILLGPVDPGFYGDVPDLTNLDDDNLIATLHMNDDHATLAASWFDVPRADVISDRSPIAGLLDLG